MQILNEMPKFFTSWRESHQHEMQELSDFIASGARYAKLDYNPLFARSSQRDHYPRALRMVLNYDYDKYYSYRMNFKKDGVYIEWLGYGREIENEQS